MSIANEYNNEIELRISVAMKTVEANLISLQERMLTGETSQNKTIDKLVVDVHAINAMIPLLASKESLHSLRQEVTSALNHTATKADVQEIAFNFKLYKQAHDTALASAETSRAAMHEGLNQVSQKIETLTKFQTTVSGGGLWLKVLTAVLAFWLLVSNIKEKLPILLSRREANASLTTAVTLREPSNPRVSLY